MLVTLLSNYGATVFISVVTANVLAWGRVMPCFVSQESPTHAMLDEVAYSMHISNVLQVSTSPMDVIVCCLHAHTPTAPR